MTIAYPHRYDLERYGMNFAREEDGRISQRFFGAHLSPHGLRRGLHRAGDPAHARRRHALPHPRRRGHPRRRRPQPHLAPYLIPPRRDTGESFRLAVETGGRIRDPELVQFHPSGIIEPEEAAGTLVSEAARGEGGILRNALGERFMARYDPGRMELSTRDRVALAAFTEIAEGRGRPASASGWTSRTSPARRS